MATGHVTAAALVGLVLGIAPQGDAAQPAKAPGVKLSEGASALGITRHPVRPLAEGPVQAAPALAVTPAGQVAVAVVRFDDEREWIELRTAKSPAADLGPARVVAAGDRAFNPRLAAGRDGSVWLAWCGREEPAAPGEHGKSVFVRRVLPGEPGPGVQISAGSGRACNPALAVASDGGLHLVWEQADPARPAVSWIAYRELDQRGRPVGDAEQVSRGPFDRRPAVLALADGVWVAWDALVDRRSTGAEDPDYDVFVRQRGPEGFGPVLPVDTRGGIQAAPALAAAPGGGLLVAYHSSHRHSLVKWWTVRRVRGRALAGLAAPDAAGRSVPSGEQQGAEFPALVALPGGRLAVFSRPSQGAFLQLVDGAGVSAPLDLTRHGWGARGMRTAAQVAPDGSLLMVRRARRGAVLERFSLNGKQARPPRFEPLEPAPKASPAPKGGLIAHGAALAGAGMRAFFGDIHMHSAASDATGAPDEVLARAWARGLHFAVLTDHDNIIGQRQPPSQQDENAWLTDAFDAKAGFACLHGYEWTTPPLPGGFGHRNVYFRDRPRTGWCAFRGECTETAELFAALTRGQAIAVPHHTTWTGTDWAAHEEGIQRLFEIVSVHGANERPGEQLIPSRGDMPGMTAVDGLGQGLRFGFAGGSDGHGLLWHHGISRKRNPWLTGLTVAYARELTRAAIFDALFARRTSATSGEPIRAVIRIGDLPMGAAGEVAGKVPIRFAAAAEGGRVELALVRDGRVIHRAEPAGPSLEAGFVDAEVDPGPHSYYIRVVNRRGDRVELAWSSPVFVKVTGKGRSAK